MVEIPKEFYCGVVSQITSKAFLISLTGTISIHVRARKRRKKIYAF
jgi:hypothetical protein